ncbi:MAG TPA: sugar phosphate isomerase/epimerase family protein, partial [Thermodesulfobacteriota bacterium]|nr:sugar phosphate isomerase/epimerase family protein [Thermodesulfobacteriota bacterium]
MGGASAVPAGRARRVVTSALRPEQIGFAASSGPVERYFPLARRLGLGWLEYGCQHPANFPQTFDRARIRRVRALAARVGIRAGLHSASFVNTAELMPTVRKAAVAHLREYVDLAAALGCEYLVIHCGFHFSAYLDRVRAALHETLAQALAYAERRRVPLVIENMNRLPAGSEVQYLGVSADELAAIFERFASPYLGLALDVAHAALLPGGVARFVRTFPERIRAVQLSDNRGGVDEHLAIGAGTIDFGRVLRLLAGIGFAGPLVIELADVRAKLVSRARLLRLLAAGDGGRPRPRAGSG